MVGALVLQPPVRSADPWPAGPTSFTAAKATAESTLQFPRLKARASTKNLLPQKAMPCKQSLDLQASLY
jgi:hypothetical protein